MTEYGRYRYALSLTSQFYFCGLPLRLDAYDKCLFSCSYCFAANRGGQRSTRGLKLADPARLGRLLSAAATADGEEASVLVALLRKRQAIHFGGMSEPFPPLEAELGVSLRLLRELADFDYPTVISTKGLLLSRAPYMSLIQRNNVVVQVSFSVRDDRLAAKLDHSAPSPTARVKLLKLLSDAGIATAARLQPLIPTREKEAEEFIDELADAGVRHVGVEYLKLPMDNSSGSTRMNQALDMDLHQLYAAAGMVRSGREWLLAPARRMETVLSLRTRAHANCMSFGAADTDFLPLSDGLCCCSSADTLLGPGSRAFEFNYLGAIRRASPDGYMSFDSLQDCWVPNGSIAEMVNSESRLPSKNGRGADIRDYIRSNWNGRPNGCSPKMFYGVEPTSMKNDDGLTIYKLTQELQSLIAGRKDWPQNRV